MNIYRCPLTLVVVVLVVLTLTLTQSLSASVVAMTIDTVELRKIQYSQELAAYTMRQWMLTHDSPHPNHGSVPGSTSGPTSAAQTTAPSSGRETRDNNTAQHAAATAAKP